MGSDLIMPVNVRAELRREIDRVKSVDDQVELARIVSESFVVSLERLLVGCVALRRLEELGHDMALVRFRGGNLLKKAAYGQILPEVVLLFLERPSLAAAASNLPIPEQKRIVDNDAFRVMTGDHDDHRMVRPIEMTPAQIRQVFARDGVRTDSQQISWIREKLQREARAAHQDVEVFMSLA